MASLNAKTEQCNDVISKMIAQCGRTSPTQLEEVPDDFWEKRWWLRIQVGNYHLRELYDPGASCTTMGPIALQNATSLERSFTPKLANGNYSAVAGTVLLPFKVAGVTKDVKVAVIPSLDGDCYVGANFIRMFKTFHDPINNRLYVKEANAYMDIEVTSVDVST